MVLVSHRKKFIYIKNLKVAGTSVEAYFEKYCVNPKVAYNPKHYFQRAKISQYGIIGARGKKTHLTNKFFNHMNARAIKRHLGRKVFNRYFKFCVIRNPYDKMVSMYFFRPPSVSFKEFCKQTDCSDIKRLIIHGRPCCNYYIRFENLEAGLKEVCKKLKIPFKPERLPSYKRGFRPSNTDYRQYYDDETRQIVYEKHKPEFELFGYEF